MANGAGEDERIRRLNAGVEREHWELEHAPLVTPGPNVPRCHFCGQINYNRVSILERDGTERWMGDCCGSLS